MATGTKVRAGRATALLVATQGAQGSYATTFDAVLWGTRPRLRIAPTKSRPGPWMTELSAEHADSRHNSQGPKELELVCHATPEAVERLLRSNWGAFAGGAFTLASQVNEYLTVAWVENTASGATEKLVRVRDVFVHRLRLELDSTGYATLRALATGSAVDVLALDALAGVTLPAAPMGPTDQNVYAGRSALFKRDPTGANETVPFDRLTLELEQNGGSEWNQLSQRWDVFKKGKTFARLEAAGRVDDETWTLMSNSLAGTKQRLRLTLAAPSPAKTLTVDLFNADFAAFEVGRAGQRYVDFEGAGQAHKTSAGFVTITQA